MRKINFRLRKYNKISQVVSDLEISPIIVNKTEKNTPNGLKNVEIMRLHWTMKNINII